MSSTKRCKFEVQSITNQGEYTHAVMVPVMCDKTGEYNVPEENKRFWEATPCGMLELSVTNESFADVKEGDVFYLDLIPVDK
jgi:hypothetical protein